jgi:hypothetical protein
MKYSRCCFVCTNVSEKPMSIFSYKPCNLKSIQTRELMSNLTQSTNICKSNPITSLDRPWRFQEVEAPRFKITGTWKWQGCQPCAPAAFTPRNNSWYSFLLRGWVDPRAIVRPEGLCKRKIPMTTTGNRSRDFPVCSAVPQPLRHRVPHQQI